MIPNNFYHIYNRGNNHQPIFFNRDNYIFFIKKARNHLLSYVNIVSYCLMPNHFHFLVYSKDYNSNKSIDFYSSLRIMLSSYTRAINKQENRDGSLFQQKTKIKLISDDNSVTNWNGGNSNGDPFICFHYIHQNPWKAGLVKKMEDWEMSSFKDYAGLRNGSLCKKVIAYDLLDIPKNVNAFMEQSYKVKIIKEL